MKDALEMLLALLEKMRVSVGSTFPVEKSNDNREYASTLNLTCGSELQSDELVAGCSLQLR